MAEKELLATPQAAKKRRWTRPTCEGFEVTCFLEPKGLAAGATQRFWGARHLPKQFKCWKSMEIPLKSSKIIYNREIAALTEVPRRRNGSRATLLGRLFFPKQELLGFLIHTTTGSWPT